MEDSSCQHNSTRLVLRTPSHHGGNEFQGESRPFGSPFASPPVPFLSPQLNMNRMQSTTKRRINTTNTIKTRRLRPEPLVLDPSGRGSVRRLSTEFKTCSNNDQYRVSESYSSASSSIFSTKKSSQNGTSSACSTSNSSLPVVQKILQVATQSLREHHATAAHYSSHDISDANFSTHNNSRNIFSDGRGYLHATPSVSGQHGSAPCSGAFLARSNSVVQAGFLQKLGKNIPEFKRRFFVLKPETNLYYYLSPNETEPRGKIDLEGSTVEHTEEIPDGRFRFILTWNNNYECDNECHNSTRGDKEQISRRRIVLEAKSKDIGEEWMRHMKGDRVSSLKSTIENLNNRNTGKDIQIADLERQLQHFRMIESDRDGALEDARNWKKKFNRLDEALRLLTQKIRKPPHISSSTTPQRDGNYDIDENTTVDDQKEEQEEEEGSCGIDAQSQDFIRDASDNNLNTPTKSNRAPALLDSLNVPGTYFSGLLNAIQQQRESLKLASVEASAAVEDVLEVNERISDIQKRMNKAEKHILKLWEENCTIRKNLKQKKREKRILIKEVKQLQGTIKVLKDTCQLTNNFPLYNRSSNEDTADSIIGSDDERLILELEEHVTSSIRLHERLIADFKDVECTKTESFSSQQIGIDRIHIGPKTPKSLSLLDDECDSDSETSCNEVASVACLKEQDDFIRSDANFASSSSINTAESSSIRSISLLNLSKNEDDGKEKNRVGCSIPKHITENGQATSRLACPLVDVQEIDGYSGVNKLNEDSKIYHLTFYSKKIGLQLQKAPPLPIKPRGLLTDAIRDDLVNNETNNNRFTAKDIVLVCGFNGFDSSKGNRKPKLGARLVAFDDVSVEAGQWTFESIRKAIEMRSSRPLTLSFRNDFLTMEQRTILTKAVKGTDIKQLRERRTNTERERPKSTTPSVDSALSHESAYFLNNTHHDHHQNDMTDLLDVSTAATEESNCWIRRFPTSSSVSTHQSSSLRSYGEETGSISSSLMTNLLKRVTSSEHEEKVVTGRYKEKRRFEIGVDPSSTTQHQDFHSNLL